jgi:hypothetical protein
MRAREFINEVNVNPKDQWFGPGQIGGGRAVGGLPKVTPRTEVPRDLPKVKSTDRFDSPPPSQGAPGSIDALRHEVYKQSLPKVKTDTAVPTRELPRITNPGNPPLTAKELGGQAPKYTQSELGTFKRTPDGKIVDPQGQVVSPRTGDPYTKADVYRDTGKSPEFKSISPERSHYARTSQADRARDARHSANAEKYADELKAAEAQFKEKGDAASFGRILDILNRP